MPRVTVYIAPNVDDDVTRAVEQTAASLGYASERVHAIRTCNTCGFFACVCSARARHAKGCAFLRAVSCAVGIECSHGADVCLTCDPCTCGAGVAPSDLGGLQVTR